MSKIFNKAINKINIGTRNVTNGFVGTRRLLMFKNAGGTGPTVEPDVFVPDTTMVLNINNVAMGTRIVEFCLTKDALDSISIDWGDGSTSTITTADTEILFAHTYVADGTYTVVINSTSPSISHTLGWEFGVEGFSSWNYDYGAGHPVQSIILGSKVNKLHDYALYGFTNLTELYIRDTVTYLGEGSLWLTTNLITVEFSKNSGITSLANSLFENSGITNFVIPNQITTLGSGVFKNTENLLEIRLHLTVTTIGTSAFLGGPNKLLRTPYNFKPKDWNNAFNTKEYGDPPIRHTTVWGYYEPSPYPEGVWYGGDTTKRIRLHDKDTLTTTRNATDKFTDNTPTEDGNIQALANDNKFVYAIVHFWDEFNAVYHKVYKVRRFDFYPVAESLRYDGSGYSITVDDNFVYASGAISGTNTVKKLDKDTLAFIDETIVFANTINVVEQDTVYLYIGCVGQAPDHGIVKKVLKSSMEVIGESPAFGADVRGIKLDGQHMYVVGDIWRIRKYLKSDLSFVSETPSLGGITLAVDLDDTHIYISLAHTNKVSRYLKTTLAYVDETPDYGGSIQDLKVDTTHIYVGGVATRRVRKYLKSDMSYVSQSVLYGGTIRAILID